MAQRYDDFAFRQDHSRGLKAILYLHGLPKYMSMKNPIVQVSMLFVFACVAVSCGPTEEKKPARYTIAQFMDIVQINGGAFSPDDSKVMISSKETGIFNAVAIDVKTGQQTPLTTSGDNAIFGLSYFPGDDRIVYTSDKGGNEINHLFVRNMDGSVIDLIQDSTAKASFAGWSYDKKLMYYVSNSRDKKFFDLYNVQVQAGEKNIYPSTLLYKNEKRPQPGGHFN
jgi:hypothetical protein